MNVADEHRIRLARYADDLGERAAACRARTAALLVRLADPSVTVISTLIAQAAAHEAEAAAFSAHAAIVRRAIEMLAEREEAIA
jgi:hypothetical protein